MPPLGNLFVEELVEGLREPRGRVDAVGDGVHAVLGEHALRDLAVLHRHAVDVAREAQCKVGHVQQTVVQRTETLDAGGALVAKDGVHLVGAELVMPGRHGRVGGEDAGLANGLSVRLCGVAKGRTAQARLEQADGQQRGVALVHVADLRLNAQGMQHMNAAEAKDGLLAEPVVGVAAVEVVGQGAVVGVVALDVRVQQEDRDDVAGTADDIKPPGANGDLTALHVDADSRARRRQDRLGRPDDVRLGLLAGGIQVLLEIAVAMHQRNGHHGGAGVGRRTQGVAGEHAETAGVGGEILAEGDLHGEVRDLAVGKVDGSGRGKRLMGRRDWVTHAQSRIHFSKRCTQ